MNEGWGRSRLRDLCEMFSDGDWIESKDQAPNGIRLIQTGNVGFGEFKGKSDKSRYVSDATFKRLRCTEIFEGDCLVSRLPEPVGRACLLPETGERMITAVDCTIIRFNSAQMIPTFFNYYAQSYDYLQEVDRKTTGTTRKRVSRSNLGETLIPFPSLAEQQRIVRVLDEAFNAIATAKANAERNLANARALFESYLETVFVESGPEWGTNQLRALTTKIGSGATPRGGKNAYKIEGIPLIRSLNVYDTGFRGNGLAFLDEAQADALSHVTVQPGDVLLNITGASVARCCVAPDNLLPAHVNQHVSIVRPVANKLDAMFLHYLLISKPYKDQLLRTGQDGGSTRQAITKAQIQDFRIRYPADICYQKQLAARIKALSDETELLESLNTRKLAALDELKQSLLHQAFAGEL